MAVSSVVSTQVKLEDVDDELKGSSFQASDIAQGGYLFKRARNSGINWRKRYFIFDENTQKLSYYLDRAKYADGTEPLGSLSLSDSSSIIPVGMRGNCLEVHTGKLEEKPLFIQCADENTLLLWKLRLHNYIHQIKSGYLEKRARKSGRNWRTRYFVLDLRNGLLRVFESDKMDHVSTVMKLDQNYEAQRSGLKQFCIEVRRQDGSEPSLFLCAKSIKSQLEWLTCFQDACSVGSPRDSTIASSVAGFAALPSRDIKANQSTSLWRSQNTSASTSEVTHAAHSPAPGNSPSTSPCAKRSIKRAASSSTVTTATTNTTYRRKILEEKGTFGANKNLPNINELGLSDRSNDSEKTAQSGGHRRSYTLSLRVEGEVIVLSRGRVKGLATIVSANTNGTFTVRMHSPQKGDKGEKSHSNGNNAEKNSGEKLLEVGPEDLFRHRQVDFDFTLGKRLGKGAFATVYAGMNHANGALIAIKKMKLKFGHQNREVLKAIMDEVRLLRELDHENIVKFLGTEFSLSDKSMYIIMEQVSGGSLESALRSFGRFSEAVIFSYTCHILKGLVYLHSQRVIHRDLKCANVLLSTAGVVKLADFGVSKKIKDIHGKGADSKDPDAVGSPYWMAPEVVLYQGYDTSCDVWSLGCTIIEMTTAYHPWKDYDNPLSCVYAIGQSDKMPYFPPDLSRELKDFILLCLNRDKTKRPQCTELMLHHGFRKRYSLNTTSVANTINKRLTSTHVNLAATCDATAHIPNTKTP